MREFSYMVHVSVDGYIEGPNGEFDWPLMGEELSAHSHDILEQVDTFAYGRVVFEGMASFWPDAESISDHPHDVRFAPIWRRTPKIVFSRTLQYTAWNTRVISDDLATSVQALKDGPGKGILLTGGASVAGALAGLGLIDEFQVFVHPVVLGGGRRVLPVADRFGLELVESRIFDSQVVLLRYRRPAQGWAESGSGDPAEVASATG